MGLTCIITDIYNLWHADCKGIGKTKQQNARVMKTTKLFLSIALVALTVISFGKTNVTDNVDFENELIMESWMASPFEASEADLVVENWMTLPFQSDENDLVVENWMTTPFQNIILEEELIVENWMTSPFGLGSELEALALESWMSTPFEATDDNCSGALMAAACN